jgi:hypothetical protein
MARTNIKTRRVASAKKRTAPARGRTQAAKARPKAKPRPKHAFTVSHPREADFKTGGLRTYVQYRDLGIAGATKGSVVAHVLRFVTPCDPAVVSKQHLHDVDFQMIYVLKGWIKSEFDGQGAHVMHAGAAWLQPPRIKHKVLDYSDDCELLEIVMPAKFATVELE